MGVQETSDWGGMGETCRAGMLATSRGPNNITLDGLCAELMVSEMERAMHHFGRGRDKAGGKRPYFRLS
jgi:hypothetical protein